MPDYMADFQRRYKELNLLRFLDIEDAIATANLMIKQWPTLSESQRATTMGIVGRKLAGLLERIENA